MHIKSTHNLHMGWNDNHNKNVINTFFEKEDIITYEKNNPNHNFLDFLNDRYPNYEYKSMRQINEQFIQVILVKSDKPLMKRNKDQQKINVFNDVFIN